jgi:hypothetical protein
LIDQAKGGYFSISPPKSNAVTTKQQYLPSSNILLTRYIQEDGVVDLVDFFPRPKNSRVIAKAPKQMPFRESINVQDELKKWLVRRAECIRGAADLGMLLYHDNLIPYLFIYISEDYSDLSSQKLRYFLLSTTPGLNIPVKYLRLVKALDQAKVKP